jgi:hypothetical protein
MKPPRTTISHGMVLVPLLAANLPIGRALFVRDPMVLARVAPIGTDREISANFDRQASATNSVLFPWSLPTESEQNRLLLSFVPPRSAAVRNLVPRFDRASNRAPKLSLSSLAVGRGPPLGGAPSRFLPRPSCGARRWCRTEAGTIAKARKGFRPGVTSCSAVGPASRPDSH